MVQPTPKPKRSLSASAADEFLMDSAAKILDGSHVATTTAAKLTRQGLDAVRLGALLDARGREIIVGTFKFKFIDADPESPENFGVLVRRV
jgi:hypothetical protein